jgi:hypothetical protein
MTERLLSKHDLTRRGWKVSFNRRFNQLQGLCKMRVRADGWLDRRIILSSRFVEAKSDYHVRNLILHEVAHALKPTEKPVHGNSLLAPRQPYRHARRLVAVLDAHPVRRERLAQG